MNDTNTVMLNVPAPHPWRKAKDGADSKKRVGAPEQERTLGPAAAAVAAVFHQHLQSVEGQALEQVLEGLYDAVVISDLEGNILFTNQRAQEFFHHDPAASEGRHIADMISGADESVLDWIAQHMAEERRVFIECYCLRSDATVFPADMTVSIITLDPGNDPVDFYCFFIRNVTARKETEEALRKAQQDLVKTAHLAGMAEIATGVLHDMGNILNSLNVSCDVMENVVHGSRIDMLVRAGELLKEHEDAAAEFLVNDPRGRRLPEVYRRVGDSVRTEYEKLQQELRNLSRNIELMREVIRVQQERAGFRPAMEQTELGELVEDALSIQQNNIATHSVEVVKQIEPTPPVPTEKSKVTYILVNLIKNAVEATLCQEIGRRKVTIRVAEEDECCVVEVVDNGIGIRRDDLPNIFTHGFTTKADGHGFGLHASANYLQELGGSIDVASSGPGLGARFTVRLPIEIATTENPDAD